MAKPNVKNFAKAQVSGGYSAGATTITLATGEGAKLPAGPFYAVWWNVTNYPAPEDDPNVEIVYVGTHVAGTDTCSDILRGQEDTAATAKNLAGRTYMFMNVFTAGMYTALNLDGGTISIGATSYEIYAEVVDGVAVLKLR